jgi:hypothetical protein
MLRARSKPTLSFLLAAAAAAVAATTAASGAALASLVVALDTPALVQRADHVAVVDVVSSTATWDAAHQRIVTTVELSVVESWKGPMAPAARLRVVQPGGTVGETTMAVLGMSRFSTGERALVFLRGRPQAASLVGMSQGKRLMRHDRATGRWMVRPVEPAGAWFVRAGAPGAAAAAHPAAGERAEQALDELRAEVQGEVLAEAHMKAQVKTPTLPAGARTR